MSLTSTNRNNCCAICKDARGKCRQGIEDLSYWQCMIYADAKKGEIVGGFKCIGRTKNGQWAEFKPDNSQNWTQQQRLEWEQENQRRRLQQKQKHQQQIASQLSAVNRHQYYSKLLDQLPLGKLDRADLEHRGFIAEQIEADGYRSVEQWQQVSSQFAPNLPGLLSDGRLNSQPGYIFPVKDIDGLIIALSIRLRDGENGRYRWLTSATKKNPQGARPHLDGELPLSIFEPTEYQGDAIWLPEGLGIKPSLTRYRLGVPVVGASSGLFSGSPNTCKITLEKLSAKYKTRRLVIPVDGGDVQNSHVSQRWIKEFEFLRSLGYEIQIAWWGQFSKEHDDIDELSLEQINQISRLTVCEFEAICREQLKAKSWGKSHEQNNSASTKKTLDLCNKPSYRDGEWQKPQEESLSFSSQSLTSLESSKMPSTASETTQASTDTTSKVLEMPITVQSKSLKPRLDFNCFKEDNPKFEEKIRQVQRQLRSLSYRPDILLNQRYLPDDLPTQLPKSGLTGLVSHKGSGKSGVLKKIIRLAKEQGIPTLSITPRIALGREQAFKWKITWIDDYGMVQTKAEDTAKQVAEIAEKKNQVLQKLAELQQPQQFNLLDESELEKIEQQRVDLTAEIDQYEQQIENVNLASVNTLGLCWDSLWRTQNRDLKNSLIIIDEAELGFKHFVAGSTCRRNRPYLLKVFADKLKECLMSGGRVILSDADLTDLSIDYVRELLPIPINPFIVKNEYIGDETRWIVDLRSGSRGDTLDEIIANVKLGFHFVVTTDSQAEAEALERKILNELPEFCAFLDSEGEITAEARAGKKAIIVRLDRNTAESKAGKTFIEKPNESILHWKPRIVIYTPTLGVGVSIDESTKRMDQELGELVPYFDFVYGLFFGVIEPSQCRQQLARVRANVPRIVWSKEFNRGLEGCTSFLPDEIKRQMLKYNHSALSIIDLAVGIAGYDADDEQIREAMLKLLHEAWDSESRCWKNPSLNLYAALKARENYGLWNLANVLREELEDEGHTVVSLEGTKSDLIEELAAIKDDLKMAEATLIAQAPIMPLEEAQKLLNKIGITKEERRSASKTLLQDELPGVELTAEFIYKAVVSDRRRWLNRQKLFWYCFNLDATKTADTDHWLSRVRKFVDGNSFIPDIRSFTPKVQAIRESGVFDFVSLEDCVCRCG